MTRQGQSLSSQITSESSLQVKSKDRRLDGKAGRVECVGLSRAIDLRKHVSRGQEHGVGVHGANGGGGDGLELGVRARVSLHERGLHSTSARRTVGGGRGERKHSSGSSHFCQIGTHEVQKVVKAS